MILCMHRVTIHSILHLFHMKLAFFNVALFIMGKIQYFSHFVLTVMFCKDFFTLNVNVLNVTFYLFNYKPC